MLLSEVFQLKSDFASQKVGTEIVLVPLKNNIAQMNKLYTLNEVACFIWENISENSTKEDIIQKITDSFDTNNKDAATDLDQFLEDLSQIINEI
jgi:uncharacterized protein YpiB (UPF0302 family)